LADAGLIYFFTGPDVSKNNSISVQRHVQPQFGIPATGFAVCQ